MISRRRLLQQTAGATFAWSALRFATPGLFADEIATAQMTEGPFYPDKMPLDTDNDLVLLNDGITPAVGEITYLSGRVLSPTGAPIRNAFVEIWQVDNGGNYIHTGDVDGRDKLDRNFQGYGRFLTNARGEYYFRTIKPVPYTHMGIFRTPHIHIAVSVGGQRVFTSQMLINGHPDNARDFLFQQIADPLAAETLLVDFKPIKGSKIGASSAEFDIVFGRTVEELDDGSVRGLGKPLGGRLQAPKW